MSAAVRVIADLWACDCCTLAHANGDACDCPNGHAERVTAGFEREQSGGAWLALNDSPSGDDDDDDDDDGTEGRIEFTWAACEICGTQLGGARTRFALLERTNESEAMS